MASRTVRLAAIAAVVAMTGAWSILGRTTPSGAQSVTQMAAGPHAASWLWNASFLSGKQVEQIASVTAEPQPVPGAWAVPATINGTSPVVSSASAAQPSDAKSELNWQDPTGSLSVEAGYAQTAVTSSSSSARAGFGSGSGSSFTLASKYLSWQQQQELTGEVAALNDAVFGPINARVQALSPVLSSLGLAVPAFQEMSPLALINVGSAEGASASAQTAVSPGFSSASGQAQLNSVQLFDGFLSMSGVKSQSESQNLSGSTTQTGSATIGELQIAGIPVAADNKGITVAMNNPVQRATLEPLLEMLLSQLASAGITLRFDESSLTDGRTEATALELDAATPTGIMAISIGHSEAVSGSGAEAPTRSVTGEPTGSASGGVSNSSGGTPASSAGFATAAPVAGSGELSPSGATIASSVAPSQSAAPPAPTPAATRGIPSWLGAVLPRAVATALGTVFLILLLGGVGVAAFPTMFIGFARRRRAGLAGRSLLTKENRP